MERIEQASGVHRVLAFLLEQQRPATRPDMARACNLSRPSVFTAIARLEQQGIVTASGQLSGMPGRSATLYEVSRSAGLVAALDIGGSNLRAAIADLRGQILVERREATRKGGGNAIVSQAASLLTKAARPAGVDPSGLAAVGVSVPGVVAADGGTVLYASNIDQPTPYDFRAPLEERLQAPVVMDNNVNLAAMAEAWCGAAQKLHTFAVVAIGAGIGAGIVHDGTLLRGAHGAAGEVAFLPPYASQGRRDLEGYDEAGGLNLLRQARQRQRWPGGEPPSTVQELFLRAEQGEKPAVRVVEEECQRIAHVIASISAVVDPQAVVLAGGVGTNDYLFARTQELAEQLVPFPPTLIRSALGEEASLIGAIHLATRRGQTALLNSLP